MKKPSEQILEMWKKEGWKYEESDNGFDAETFVKDLKNVMAEEATNSTNSMESDGMFNMNLFDE